MAAAARAASWLVLAWPLRLNTGAGATCQHLLDCQCASPRSTCSSLRPPVLCLPLPLALLQWSRLPRRRASSRLSHAEQAPSPEMPQCTDRHRLTTLQALNPCNVTTSMRQSIHNKRCCCPIVIMRMGRHELHTVAAPCTGVEWLPAQVHRVHNCHWLRPRHHACPPAHTLPALPLLHVPRH